MSVCAAHLRKQIKQLHEKPVPGFSVEVIDDDITKWRVWIRGIRNTPYEGGIFRARLEFPQDYPFLPPTMIFESKMWHPNIYPDGKVCISILHPPGEDKYGYEDASERWSPIQSVESILISVMSMMSDPNDESPANLDAAIEWRKKPKDYAKRCKQLVDKANSELAKDFIPPLDFDTVPLSSGGTSSSSSPAGGGTAPSAMPGGGGGADLEDEMEVDSEVVPPEHRKYEKQLRALAEMGLNNSPADAEKCVKLLQSCKGELERVITMLVSE
eukprot:RCo023934